MPSRRKDIPQIIEIIAAHKDFIYDSEQNKFLNPSNDCWKSISMQLNNGMTPKYIYTIVTTNRYDIKNILNLNSPSQLKDKTEFDNHSEISTNELEENTITFKITLSSDEWLRIKPQAPKLYQDRLYEILVPYEWTSIIHEHFYIHTKRSCSISYKRAKVYPTGPIYVKIEGECTACNSIFEGYIDSVPETNSKVIINCSYAGNFKNCHTTRKRRIIGYERKNYIKAMLDKKESSTYIRRSIAKNVMNYGDLEPSNLPSLNSLRVMKHRALKEKQLHDDAILALAALKSSLPYSEIIRDIGYDRFFIHYWSVAELNSYRIYCRQNKITQINVDASGGFVRKVCLISGRLTKEIFLYEIVISSKSGQFSIAHMLSERHDNNSICHWLGEWLRNDIPLPKVAVSDHSLALMMGLVKALTQYSSLAKYLNVCSYIILNQVPNITCLPHCFLRNDFNHTMNLISKWPEMKILSRRIKNFYMRAIGLIVICTEWSEMELLFQNIFTVALHEDDGFGTVCGDAKRFLKERIATHNKEHNIDNILDQNEEEADIESFEDTEETDIFQEIQKIYEKCKVDGENKAKNVENENVQYNPAIAKRLLEMSKTVVCWSAIMVPIFGHDEKTVSTASVESTFNDLKHRVFAHHTLPTRLDSFLQIHITSILGSMNLTRAQQDIEESNEQVRSSNNQCIEDRGSSVDSPDEVDVESKNNISIKVSKKDLVDHYIEERRSSIDSPDEVNIECKDNTIIEDSRNSTVEIEEENWKGKAKKTKKVKHRYTDPDPTILHHNLNSYTKSKTIGILRNGSKADLKSCKFGKFNYTFLNTCPFDSLLQLLFCAYSDSTLYAQYVDENLSDILFELISHTVRDGVNTQTYRKRAIILQSIFSKSTSDSHLVIDTACTSTFMLSTLLENYPSCVENHLCKLCNLEKRWRKTSILANLPSSALNDLQEVLDNLGNSHCETCGNITSINRSYAPHVFIEICPRSICSNIDLSPHLQEIPERILLNANLYTLRGAISFVAPASKSKDAIGHYIAYAYRVYSDAWEKYDDLSNKVKIVRKSLIIPNCQYVCYSI